MTMYTQKLKINRIETLILILILNVCIPGSIYAQSTEFSEIRTQLDSIFSDLDFNRVHTGILLDYGIDLVDFDCYDGTAVNNAYYTDFSTLNSLIAGIHSSSVGENKPFPQPHLIREVMHNDLTSAVMPVGVIAYRYNKIIDKADSLGLIENTGSKLLDKYQNGRWCNPYELADVFGMSPLMNSFNSRNVTYKFSHSYFLTNLDIEIMEFDPGDGHGFRPFSPYHSINVSYVEDGYHDIHMKLTLVDGTVLNARSSINIFSSSAQNEFGSDPTEPESTTFTTNYNGTTVKADVTFYLRSGKTIIQKPFIYAEGFNITDPGDLSININDILDKNTKAKDFHEEFEHTDLFNNYDVVYIDWKNANECIEANAVLLQDIITNINQIKASDAERNIIMGESMGGLICRYALCTMENMGIDHHTKIYVSLDSPHLGANLPIGLQYLYHDLRNIVYNIKTAINYTFDLFEITEIEDYINLIDHNLHSSSARQMAINYIDANGMVDNSIHEELMEDMLDLGFPTGTAEHPIINLAISNGDINPINQQDNYIDMDFNISLKNLVRKFENDSLGTDFFNKLIGKRNLHMDIEARPHIQSNQIASKILLQYKKKGLIDFNKTIYSSIRYASGPYPVDASSGSIYKIPIDLNDVDTLKNYGFSINNLEIQDKLLFVPSHSSLCIGGGHTDINTSISQQDYRSLGENIDTPFDEVYIRTVPDTNIVHIYKSNDMLDWIASFEDYAIIGPTNANDGDRFVLAGYEGLPEWSCENASYLDSPLVITPVASISDTGVLTVNQYGHINVTASFTNEFGNTISLTKPVVCGLPSFTLTTNEIDSPTLRICYWNIKASHSDNHFRKLQSQLGAQYQWKEYASDEWETRDSTISVSFDSDEIGKNIYFRFKTNNVTSPTYNVNVLNRYYSQLPFVPELPPIVVDGNGDLSIYDSTEIYGNTPTTKSGGSASLVLKCCGVEINILNCIQIEEILEQLLKSSDFIETLHTLKPWGEKEMLMIPIEWCYGNGEHISTKQFKVIYKNW